MTLTKDYSWCPPKKRPIPVWSPEPATVEVDENEEPQDLSLKTRQRLKDYPPPPPLSPLPPSTRVFPSIDLTSKLTSFPLSRSAAEDKNSFRGNEGLYLISEVASKLEGERPSVLRASVKGVSTPLQNRRGLYAPPTPRSPARVTLGERGSWSYHPYLPLAVYGFPSSPYSVAKTASSPIPIPNTNSVVPRGSSASPPGDNLTETSSGSEGSPPELRGEKLSCPDCGRGYATVAGLSRHHQFHCHRDVTPSFACKHCAKVYTSIGALKMHIRTHTLPCKCHVCGKAFSRPWLLQGHIRTHTGEKPFECQQCHRSFADRSNLRAHQQTHERVKKYACHTCKKTFSRMSLLNKHSESACMGSKFSPIPEESQT